MNKLELQSHIVIENPKGSYKDFGLKSPGDYPIPGVDFYADYGYLPEYTGEDGHELDFFVGSDPDGNCGFFTVWRTEEVPEEHKFYVDMSDEELERTLKEYEAVFVRHQSLKLEAMLELIEEFKDSSS